MNLRWSYFPSGGVVYSLLLHELAFIGLLYLPIANNLLRIHYPIVRAVQAREPDPPEILWLPVLNDGGMTEPPPAGKTEGRAKESRAALPAKKEGLSYPGPQPILSDPPKPTNAIQTLLEPALENPPILKPPLLLPNIVQTALIEPAQEPKPPKPKPPDPEPPPKPQPPPPPVVKLKPIEPEPVKTPTVPVVKPNAIPLPPVKPAVADRPDPSKLIMPEPPAPEPVPPPPPPKVEPPKTEPAPAKTPIPKTPPPKTETVARAKPPAPPAKPPVSKPAPPARTLVETPKESLNQDLSQMTVRAADLHNILALTPMPAAAPEKPMSMPAGEARGRFAISPQPNLTASTTEPGSKVENSPPAAGTNNPAVVSVTFGSKENSASASVTGTGTNTGATKGKDAASAGAAAGPGTGLGSGVGPKEGPFSGITIVGGVRDPGAPANTPLNPPTPRRPLQTSFGITVISTEGSGGGLPAFGVFGQRQVYTVFLDMRETETDPAPSWTLEFAVLSDSGSPANAAGNPSQTQQGLVLPFPAVKAQPTLPANVVGRNLGQMAIVYAVIGVEGKIEEISVKQSPDPSLNAPLINSLRNWVFRPAQVDGKPVRAQVLMGIPLWLPE